MRIYVASSWRNDFQPAVVAALRADGHEVYDFKDTDGFHWSEVDPAWQDWPKDVPKYLTGLDHPCAKRGFNRDMTALRECEACVYVMPCGVSASLEAGWACGAGKLVIVYVPGLREPDLMVKMADMVTDDLSAVRKRIKDHPFADRPSTLAADLRKMPTSLNDACRSLELAADEIERLRAVCDGQAKELNECEQIAGQTLGYPWFMDDEKNFPDATEADGVCVGEHVAGTIVAELAQKYEALKAERDGQAKELNDGR